MSPYFPYPPYSSSVSSSHSSYVSLNPYLYLFLNPGFNIQYKNIGAKFFSTIFINMMKLIKIPFYLAIGFATLALSPILLIKSIIQ